MIDQNKKQVEESQKQVKTMVDELDVARQNLKLVKEEINNRLRPWIGIEVADFRRHDNGKIIMDNDKVFISLKIKNYGNYPATAFQLSEISSNKIIEVKEMPQFKPNTETAYLMPFQDLCYNTYINRTQYDNIDKDTSILFFAIYIQYNNDMTKKTHYTWLLYQFEKVDGVISISLKKSVLNTLSDDSSARIFL